MEGFKFVMCINNNLYINKPHNKFVLINKFVILVIITVFSLFQVQSVIAQPGEGGEALYKYWCSTCHGDKGQGLTDEWRASWPPGKQNCWQSKCHAGNHPPDGFQFPKKVPAVIGTETLHRFTTTEDLYHYVTLRMPYWAPGSLSTQDYQEITTFIMQQNYAQRGFETDVSFEAPSQKVLALPIHTPPEDLENEASENVSKNETVQVLEITQSQNAEALPTTEPEDTKLLQLSLILTVLIVSLGVGKLITPTT